MEKKAFPLILISVVCIVTAQLLLKYGLQNIKTGLSAESLIPFFQSAFSNPYIITGIALFISSAALWLVVLSKAELSYAYPALSIGYVLTAVSSWLLFNENLGLLRIAGIALICIGVIALSRS